MNGLHHMRVFNLVGLRQVGNGLRQPQQTVHGPRRPAIPGSLLLHTKGGIFSPIMSGQGSTGNVIAAICSFFIPGLGQLVQGRLLMAIIQFCLAGVLWYFLLGWVIHLWSILDAALFRP